MADNDGRKTGRIWYFFRYVSCMFGMWIKKWSRIQGSACHKVCIILPISMLFERNLPIFEQYPSRAMGDLGHKYTCEIIIAAVVIFDHRVISVIPLTT